MEPNQLIQTVENLVSLKPKPKPVLTQDTSGRSSPVLLEQKNGIYYKMWRRWKVKKKIYNSSAILFKRIDTIMFRVETYLRLKYAEHT